MPLSYSSQVEKEFDKIKLNEARLALRIAANTLKLDECELWRLHGKRGSITTWGDDVNYLLSIYTRRSIRAWSAVKTRLNKLEVIQNAEQEGCFRFTLSLDTNTIRQIRMVAGFRQPLSESRIKKLRGKKPGAV